MSSLMKKLCDTMPLSGVVGALAASQGSLKDATVGQLSRHLRYHAQLSQITFSCKRPGIIPTKDGTQIWGYEIPADPTRVKQVTCRVTDDSYNNYVVLEEIEWGYAPRDDPHAFSEAVRVAIDDAQAPIELPFKGARLMSFTTQDGQNPENLHWLWPIQAMHDPSFVHVYAYDITAGTGKIVPLNDPDHPDAAKVRQLLLRCQEINDADPNDERKVEDFLFEDDLWQEDYSTASPSGTVPESVDLTLTPIRVLVALSLTVCRERDDFQPGRPMGVARIYPHVMVVANAPLLWVDAGLRLRRPTTMTLLDGAHCGCSEMLSDIGSLLVADSNANGMVVPDVGAPLIHLANLFNYYVPDPFLAPTLSGKLIPVISPLKSAPRSVVGFVDRDCTDLKMMINRTSNRFRVTKVRRQGQFDNIHLAPRMVVKDTIDQVVTSGGAKLKFTSAADWKMDSVTMAPFCAHDCFHMHWRWTNNGNTERATFGWGPMGPCQVVGAPMVPLNQEVSLLLLSPSSFSYLAQARGPRHNEWQPFCHHGAGYGLSSGSLLKMAKLQASWIDGIQFERFVTVPKGGVSTDTVTGDWALFYWRLRYTFKEVDRLAADGSTVKAIEIVERFSFKNQAGALDL